MKKHGFTMIEIIVALGIMLFISAQVLISFSSLRENSTLTRAAQELAFNIRRAQNMALAVTPVRAGGVSIIPASVGIQLSSGAGNNTKYFFFSDLPSNNDKKYTDASERIDQSDVSLPSGINISAISGVAVSNPEAHIIFYSPEATLFLTNYNGVGIPSPLTITLRGTTGGTRTITVRISGQINVTNP